MRAAAENRGIHTVQRGFRIADEILVAQQHPGLRMAPADGLGRQVEAHPVGRAAGRRHALDVGLVLGPGGRDRARVAHQVQHLHVEVGAGQQQRGLGRELAAVDDHPRAHGPGRRAVGLGQRAGVAHQLCALAGRGQDAPGVPCAGLLLPVEHVLRVFAPRLAGVAHLPHHRRPDVALGQARAAAADRVGPGADRVAPQVVQLAGMEVAVDFVQQVADQRAAAAAPAGDVEDGRVVRGGRHTSPPYCSTEGDCSVGGLAPARA